MKLAGAAIVLLMLGLAALAFVPTAKDKEVAAKDDKLTSLRALQEERASMARQGANPEVLARLDAQIASAAENAASLGAEIDSLALALDASEVKNKAIEDEFAHYRLVSWSDTIQRDNSRGAVLQNGDAMVRSYRAALELARTEEQIDRFLVSARRSLLSSRGRIECFQGSLDRYTGTQTGCGRFGWAEPSETERALGERQRVYNPLLALVQTAVRRKQTIVVNKAKAEIAARRAAGGI